MTVTKEAVLELLEQVDDPEIPGLSIVDLAMVRNINVRSDSIEIEITPTYSGCPAIEAIVEEIQRVIEAYVGRDRTVRVTKVLSPPWTTQWLSHKARKRLSEQMIVPPRPVVISHPRRRYYIEDSPDDSIPCPHCKSPNTQEISRFGSTGCKALYRCESCQEPFEYMKEI
ncbi:ring-1,2-phenylacetyl-CoA epoxidase subunit PaaD [Ferrithrix thermotolerans DSM 19514]|uniref:Ring-1,2-phenylacetyl-CoA epoxidase subunit PaaD n=1 Tax=Ferrithrix thermotolerans DSM 19514 TaxID=1121881 RepID=A0A1M4UHB0_9ACTN|nr:1,2-phenylacetyl-CoA epoxidase subunit PaaD [Ferrithrix thermotolerans]SHE56038.1 ring-1,2-phenylacetyl-CoA epoxidase subunit PaaD [Ferrithrix thermotolerans DSM 19514]